ncbi:hypothetical protein KIW84_043416 [Lathyrus oleraceus]|uniref:indole-3-glycerol-phosphate synthase n=1 Tax=Pisum sativum TaxID=3888 RepID=A0A9D4XHX6_PEA|nr:hypothetical protein KIW84_043416 [Pisum sativum]
MVSPRPNENEELSSGGSTVVSQTTDIGSGIVSVVSTAHDGPILTPRQPKTPRPMMMGTSKQYMPSFLVPVYQTLGMPTEFVANEKYFKGSFENLELIRNARVKCPLLCKEFIIDAWQLYYDQSKGAYAVLLIAAVLPDIDIKYMVKICKLLGLAALVEVHDERKFDRVLRIESVELIGINNLQKDIADAAVIRVILLNCEPAEQHLTALKNYDKRKISKSNSVTTRNIFNSPACITVQVKSPQAKQTCPIVCFEESDPANQRHES